MGRPNAEFDRKYGRQADRPLQFPWNVWRDILLRTWYGIGNDRLGLLAAGVAFYSLLAMFPGLAALISISGLLIDPETVSEQLAFGQRVLPGSAWQVVEEQLSALVEVSGGELTIAAVVGLLISLFTARLAAATMMEALNAIYEEREARSIVTVNLHALGLTLGGLILFGLALTFILVVPAVLVFLAPAETTEAIVSGLRWPILALSVYVALTVLYRYGPSRRLAKWRWLSWGSFVATVLWLAGSALFSWYVAEFDSYNKMYGTMGAFIVLLMWLWLSSFVALLGAEFDKQLEHQTGVDSTVGPDRPRGDRGAHVADTLAGSCKCKVKSTS